MKQQDPLNKLYTAMKNLNERLKLTHNTREIELWVGCPLARYDSYTNADGRSFAHTGHVNDVICIVEKAFLLSYPYIYGVLAHEIGHIIAKDLWQDEREGAADEAAYCFLGVMIRYGERNIQYLSTQALESIHKVGAA